MFAAWYERTGPAAEVIQVGELDAPEPSSEEVLVRLYASGVNPADVKRRSGWRNVNDQFDRIIPHGDGAGIIEAVGPGVPLSRVGERVWVHQMKDQNSGTAAEYTTLPSDQVYPLPDHLSFAEGACLGVPAVTAYQAVMSDGPVTGQTLLIAGGAGAVAHYAIQFAKLSDAKVMTTVSSEEKAAHAKTAGADTIINYKTEDVAARVLDLTDGAGVDRIVEVDFGANLPIDVPIIKPAGVIASYSSTAIREPILPYYPLAYKGVTLHFVQAYVMAAAKRQAMLADILRRLESGALMHRVGSRFKLSETATAHEALESGRVIGNVVVDIA
ncbi:MAG: NADPH:quinone reductase [Candidatus Tectomicrobia bacterium]|nr:NADPH:quinone reductase [Candidatus Tectomicrobia bacterium]